MATYIQLTSTRKTALYLQREAILLIEGFSYSEGDLTGHEGARITLSAGQWSETIYCLEDADEVIALARGL